MVPWGGPATIKPWLKQNQFPSQHQPIFPAKSFQQQTSWQPRYPTFKGGKGAWGKGKGSWGGGKGGWGGGGHFVHRNPPPVVSNAFKVDENTRYTGVVAMYAKWKGYGFVEMAQKGVVPADKLFVHWKSLQSEDRFPFLQKGMEVEFGVSLQRDWKAGGLTVRAKQVSLAGGMSISLQDDTDAQEKSFVGGQHLRYTGTLKFFTPRHGFGYVVMDQGYDVDPSVPHELRVETSEVNAGGHHPRFMENLAVEFGIWRTPKGKFNVYNMTLPGGHPLTQDALENRISMGPQTFRGEIAIWNWRHGWGFIRVDPSMALPPRVAAKLQQQNAAAKLRGKSVSNDKMMYFRKMDCAPSMYMVRQGMQVHFQLYIDDKGAGACDIRG